MKHIRIEQHENELRKLVWGFITLDQKIILDTFHIEFKETKKHKWRVAPKSKYNRIIKRESDLQEGDVNLPDEVKRQAMDELISEIEVLKWSEYKN